MNIKFMVQMFNIGANLQDKMYDKECYEQDVKERNFQYEKVRRIV